MEEGNQQDSLLRVNREVGDPPEGRVKFEGASQGYEFSSEESEGEETNREVEDDPPDSSSLEGRVKFEGASQGYEFSSEESEGEENNREVRDDPLESSSSEGRVKSEGASRVNESSSEESIGEENNRDKRDTDESIEEEEKGGEDNIGTCVTDEEEDGAVTVLKLSNGVMFRVPVEVQGMQLQAVVDTAAQVTLVSEEFYKSLDPAPPICKEVVMNTAGKGMQMNGYIAGPFQVVLGTHLFTVEIYVAPIEEDMLLGLDFLEANWKDRGGRYSPPRNTEGGWSRENTNPLLRESRGRTRHTLGRENEIPRIVQRRDEYERERGHYRPSGEDIEGPGGRNPSIPRVPSSGNRPGCPSRRDPENSSRYARREEYEGERGQRGRGKSVSLPMSLKFDGKSNWKAFYAKFSRYAEVK